MKTILKRVAPYSVLIAAALLALAARLPRASANPNETPDVDSPWTETRASAAPRTPEAAIRYWPEIARLTARALIGKYGPPDSYGPNALVWRRNGPWNKTVLYGRATTYPRFDKDQEILKQVIGYRVPEEKEEELLLFDPRLVINRASGELSFQSARESTNFLALNLADEIVRGRRSVAQARRFFLYAEDLRLSGKSSKYEDGFLFRVRLSSLDYPQ